MSAGPTVIIVYVLFMGHVQNPPDQNSTSQIWEPLTNRRYGLWANSDIEKLKIWIFLMQKIFKINK